VDKLRQIIADISAATADASQRGSLHRDTVDSRSCQYDSVTPALATKVSTVESNSSRCRSVTPASATKVNSAESNSCQYDNLMAASVTEVKTVDFRSCQYDNVTPASATKVDTSDVSTGTDVLTHKQFVSNTLLTLSAVASAPARTRATMREMQDSNSYVSFTSPTTDKHLPVCPAIGQRPPQPDADVEKEWKQIVCAAEETLMESSSTSVDELTDASASSSSSENLVVNSDQQQTVAAVSSKSSQPPPPLLFANPLFVYRREASDSGPAVTNSSSVIPKSCSLSSVAAGSNGVGSPPADAAASLTGRSNGPGHSVHTRQRVGSSCVDGWIQPSQSSECLADGNTVQPQPARHAAVLSVAEPTTQLAGMTTSRSHGTELPVDTQQSTHNALGLDRTHGTELSEGCRMEQQSTHNAVGLDRTHGTELSEGCHMEQQSTHNAVGLDRTHGTELSEGCGMEQQLTHDAVGLDRSHSTELSEGCRMEQQLTHNALGLDRSYGTELSEGCVMDTQQSTHNAVGLLDTPPDSPYCVSTDGRGAASGSHRVTASQNTVRMGVRSVQRGRTLEPDKSKIEVR